MDTLTVMDTAVSMSFADIAYVALGWMGLYGAAALAAIGSMIGCTIAGQSACGALMEVESGYAKYTGLSALPSSQSVYGLVIALTLKDILDQAGGMTEELTAPFFVIGILSGVALMWAAIKQGECIAAAVKVSKSKPEVFGAAIIPAAVVESFALFAFIVAYLASTSFVMG
ncbi:MAG: ATP synthase subunit C [Alphaproteobacteria bacterium]